MPPSQYLPKDYRDRRLRNNEMDSIEFTEFPKRLATLDVQWPVELWRITAMVNYVFKDNCVLWLGFVIALTIPQTALQGNLEIVNGYLMMMVSFISQSSLRESLARSVRLG